jgi:hypothetical protein
VLTFAKFPPRYLEATGSYLAFDEKLVAELIDLLLEALDFQRFRVSFSPGIVEHGVK